MGLSLIEEFATIEDPDLRRERLEQLTPDERVLLAGWGGQSRPEQREPDNDHWTYWAAIGGRGSGKTRMASEWVCDRIEGIDSRTRQPVKLRATYVGFIGRSSADVRRIMVDGESGFVSCAEARGMRVIVNPSRAQLTVFCTDGHVATITWYSAEEPDSLRGPQHDTVWGDEFAAWARKTDAVGNTAFTNATATLRLSDQPRGIFSTTPKVSPEIKAIFNDQTGDWVMSRMTTWENQSNLPTAFVATLRRQHPTGSRLAQQEFEGVLLEEVEGALWSLRSIDRTRIPFTRPMPLLPQRAVAVDPSIQWRGQGNECGIVAGGVTEHQQFVVTHDASIEGLPEEWGPAVVRTANLLETKIIVAEGNNGGAMVASVITSLDPTMQVEIVFASDGKRARAEPVAFLWDQLRAGIYGSLPGLEGQMTGWSGLENESPDRVDALAWLGHWALKRMNYLPPGFALSTHRRLESRLDAPPLIAVSDASVPHRARTRKERLQAIAARTGHRRRRRLPPVGPIR